MQLPPGDARPAGQRGDGNGAHVCHNQPLHTAHHRQHHAVKKHQRRQNGGHDHRPQQVLVIGQAGRDERRQPPASQKMRHSQAQGQQRQHNALHGEHRLEKALFVPPGIAVRKHGDERIEQVSRPHLQQHDGLRDGAVNAQRRLPHPAAERQFGDGGRGGVQKAVHRQRQALPQQRGHAGVLRLLRRIKSPRLRQRINEKHHKARAQHQRKGQNDILGEPQRQCKGCQRHRAAHRIGLAHDVQPPAALVDGVVDIGKGFHHAVAQEQQYADALLGTVWVFARQGAHRYEADAQRHSQRTGPYTAADVGACAVLTPDVRHLKAVHAVGCDGQKNARGRKRRIVHAGNLLPGQAHHQDTAQELAQHIGELSECIPQKIPSQGLGVLQSAAPPFHLFSRTFPRGGGRQPG